MFLVTFIMVLKRLYREGLRGITQQSPGEFSNLINSEAAF